MRKGKPIGRMINGVVFGLSTPRRHGNSKSSNFMNEVGLPLGTPKEPEQWAGIFYLQDAIGTTGIYNTNPIINKPNKVGFKRN